MLATLHVKCWSGKMQDRKATKEIEDLHNANHAGKFVKNLVRGDGILKELKSLAGEIRTYHYAKSLAWNDNGDRLLPAKLYFEYLNKMNEMKQKFLSLAADYATNIYPEEIEEAKQRLNGLFQESDYPTPAGVLAAFSVECKIMPVSEASDFRVDITEDEVDRIKTQITEHLKESESVAVGDTLDRIKSCLSAMVERLSQPEAVFRDSLVTNIQDLVKVLPALNLFEDARIGKLCDEMKTLAAFSPSVLRNNESARHQAAERAKQLLSEYGL